MSESTMLDAEAPLGTPEVRPPAVRVCGSELVRIDRLVKSFPLRRPWRKALRHPFQREHVPVLRGVSLQVHRGEFFGLLGPNGAGKTTLFKILATLVLPESGSVEVAGKNVLTDPAAVRGVLTPVIADERSLAWRLSGLQNLELFAALYGIKTRERERTAERLLDAVGLDHAGSRMVGTYSSGMKQRLLIARALLSRPSVLLLDEPTRSLDPISARDFRKFLRDEIVGRQGCTVLLATHDADEAFELCDRLAVLDRGVVVAGGTVAELARSAGENRYRLLVRSDQVSNAERTLQHLGHGPFTRIASGDEAWACLEGAIPGGASACAELIRMMVEADIPVGELARIPLSLADLIERLTARENR